MATAVNAGKIKRYGQLQSDELTRIFVDTTDTEASRDFFIEFKERLKSRFNQLDIWMTTYPIEVL